MPHRPMPPEREAITRKLKIGKLEGYITAGKYPDGTLGEVFLTIQKNSEADRGLCSALGQMISCALQRGVPVKDVVEKLSGIHSEPEGFTGNAEIPKCHGVVDYLARWIERRFVPEAEWIENRGKEVQPVQDRPTA